MSDIFSLGTDVIFTVISYLDYISTKNIKCVNRYLYQLITTNRFKLIILKQYMNYKILINDSLIILINALFPIKCTLTIETSDSQYYFVYNQMTDKIIIAIYYNNFLNIYRQFRRSVLRDPKPDDMYIRCACTVDEFKSFLNDNIKQIRYCGFKLNSFEIDTLISDHQLLYKHIDIYQDLKLIEYVKTYNKLDSLI